jgi:hypothetical protein
MNKNLPKKERYIKLGDDLKALNWDIITPFSEFKNQREKALLKCPNGHTVSMLPYHVLTRAKGKGRYCGNGLGCPKCSGFHKTIDDLNEFAIKCNWKCLSKKYKTQRDLYIWECPNGHSVERTFHHFVKAQSCEQCQTNIYSLKDFVAISKMHKGNLISENDKKYSKSSLLTFECLNGHRFRTNYTNALKHWCPNCKLAA